MRWISYLRYLLNLLKTVPLNGQEIVKFSGKIKDVLVRPSESSVEFLTAILNRQNFIIKRIFAIVLLILAMVFGADIGIDYGRKNSRPELFEPKILTEPLTIPEQKPEPQKDSLLINPSNEIDQTIIAEDVPIPKEPKQNFSRPPLPKRAVGEKAKPKFKYEEIYSGPFHLGTSGPNGY